MKKLLLLGLSLFLFSGWAMSQTITLTGKVISSEDNLGVPFANVVVKGTTLGITTDLDGNFSFNVPETATQLEFSYLGFKTVIVDIGTQRNFNVTLTPDAMNLDEVVVVGYGTQRKSHLTGSVSKIGDDAIRDLPVATLGQALIGKTAGLNITNTTSEAGVAPQIRVRGMGSISANSEPLVVVDGVPIQDGLNFIESSDVESIEILKDAASTAIYGSRGSNGVILVTTKSGEIAKPKYTFTTTQGYRRAYKLNERYSYTEYVEQLYRERDLRRADDQYVQETYPNGSPLSVNITNQNNSNAQYLLEQMAGGPTNWEELSLRDFAYNNSYQLSVSGGSKEVKYYLSGNVSNDQGIMKYSTYSKMSLRAKVDANLSPYVKVGVNLSPTYSERERPFRSQTDFTRWQSCFPVFHNEATAALTGEPVGSYTQPSQFAKLLYEGYLPDGTFWSSSEGSPSGSSNTQPMWINDNGSKITKDYRLQASAYVDVTFLKDFTFRTTESFYVNYRAYDEFQRTGLLKAGEPNKAIAQTSLRQEFLTENILNYNKTINKFHSINALAGVTYQSINYTASSMAGTNLPTESIKTLNQATEIVPAETYIRIDPSRVLASYLGRVNYAYRDKYLASASIRADGSSRFGPDNRWGWFPSVALGWRISEEEFLQSQRNWLDQLKLRLSWGITGNDDIEALAYENLVLAANYQLGSTGGIVSGMAPITDALGNSTIGWEQTKEWNAGFDFSVFAGRIGVTADFYYAITDGLLLKQTSMGFTGHYEYWNNIGTIRNKGVEIELNTVNFDKKKFKWKTSFNIAANDNRLLSLGEEYSLPSQRTNVSAFDRYIAIVGQKPIQFYGYVTDGVWISQAEIDEAKAAGLTSNLGNYFTPGGLKIKDISGPNGVPDGVIDEYDRTTIGDPFPKFTWGLTNTFIIGDFDVSILIQGVQGVSLYNDDGRYNENVRTSKTWNTPDRWVSPNNPGDGKTPFETNGFQKASTDYMIENGSYMALRNISVGYKLPSNVAKKLSLKSVRIYATVENPLYVWNIGNKSVNKYRGVNPEARLSYDNPLIDGVQNGSFAIQSSYVIGLNITF